VNNYKNQSKLRNMNSILIMNNNKNAIKVMGLAKSGHAKLGIARKKCAN